MTARDFLESFTPMKPRRPVMLVESKYAPAEPLKRVLSKGIRQITDEDKSAIKLAFDEATLQAREALKKYAEHGGQEYCARVMPTIDSLERSGFPDHVRCTEAERQLRAIFAELSSLPVARKQEHWAEATMHILFITAQYIRREMRRIGFPIELYPAVNP